MNPLLICAGYPQENHEAGGELRLPLFVVNDHERGLGELRWVWELFLGRSSVARGEGNVEVPRDCVVRIGEARATLPVPGYARLRLRLFGKDGPVCNEYAFVVS
jgi:hypothetical protein